MQRRVKKVRVRLFSDKISYKICTSRNDVTVKENNEKTKDCC